MDSVAKIDGRKSVDIEEIRKTLEKLTPIQVDVIRAILERFSEDQKHEHLRNDFLSEGAFEYFSMRLAAHHAYSSQPLKKENFEHILEQAFSQSGQPAQRADSMTARGADLYAGDFTLSLKTEAAKNLHQDHITISKLMEAAWIKQVNSLNDIPDFIHKKVLPHFDNYDKIFVLRSYPDPDFEDYIRYDLREIPKDVLSQVSKLRAEDFSRLTKTRTTSAKVSYNGRVAFKFRLDGSDDKLTVNYLDVDLCPLHAWWSLIKPD